MTALTATVWRAPDSLTHPDYGPVWLGILLRDGATAWPFVDTDLSPECSTEADAVDWCRTELLARGVREPVIDVQRPAMVAGQIDLFGRTGGEEQSR